VLKKGANTPFGCTATMRCCSSQTRSQTSASSWRLAPLRAASIDTPLPRQRGVALLADASHRERVRHRAGRSAEVRRERYMLVQGPRGSLGRAEAATEREVGANAGSIVDRPRTGEVPVLDCEGRKPERGTRLRRRETRAGRGLEVGDKVCDLRVRHPEADAEDPPNEACVPARPGCRGPRGGSRQHDSDQSDGWSTGQPNAQHTSIDQAREPNGHAQRSISLAPGTHHPTGAPGLWRSSTVVEASRVRACRPASALREKE
jgi:hypothetical protein